MLLLPLGLAPRFYTLVENTTDCIVIFYSGRHMILTFNSTCTLSLHRLEGVGINVVTRSVLKLRQLLESLELHGSVPPLDL